MWYTNYGLNLDPQPQPLLTICQKTLSAFFLPLFWTESGPGVRDGDIDTKWVVVHDEAPQMINHGDSSFTKTRSLGCREWGLKTLGRRTVSASQFNRFRNWVAKRVHRLFFLVLDWQVTWLLSRQETSRIFSVNKSGVTDHVTLLAAYQDLDRILEKRCVERPIIVITDGHSSRFDEKVLKFLHPDTFRWTHDQSPPVRKKRGKAKKTQITQPWLHNKQVCSCDNSAKNSMDTLETRCN